MGSSVGSPSCTTETNGDGVSGFAGLAGSAQSSRLPKRAEREPAEAAIVVGLRVGLDQREARWHPAQEVPAQEVPLGVVAPVGQLMVLAGHGLGGQLGEMRDERELEGEVVVRLAVKRRPFEVEAPVEIAHLEGRFLERELCPAGVHRLPRRRQHLPGSDEEPSEVTGRVFDDRGVAASTERLQQVQSAGRLSRCRRTGPGLEQPLVSQRGQPRLVRWRVEARREEAVGQSLSRLGRTPFDVLARGGQMPTLTWVA